MGMVAQLFEAVHVTHPNGVFQAATQLRVWLLSVVATGLSSEPFMKPPCPGNMQLANLLFCCSTSSLPTWEQSSYVHSSIACFRHLPGEYSLY